LIDITKIFKIVNLIKEKRRTKRLFAFYNARPSRSLKPPLILFFYNVFIAALRAGCIPTGHHPKQIEQSGDDKKQKKEN